MGRKHTVRHRVRRKLEGCAKSCDTINTHLADCASYYQEVEPDRYQAMLYIGSVIEDARKLLLKLREVI